MANTFLIEICLLKPRVKIRYISLQKDIEIHISQNMEKRENKETRDEKLKKRKLKIPPVFDHMLLSCLIYLVIYLVIGSAPSGTVDFLDEDLHWCV